MTDPSQVAVLGPVMPGSLVVLRGDSWLAWDESGEARFDDAAAAGLVAQITKISGHDRFVCVHVIGDDVQLVGPEELLDLVRDVGRAVIQAEAEAAEAERKLSVAERKAARAGKPES